MPFSNVIHAASVRVRIVILTYIETIVELRFCAFRYPLKIMLLGKSPPHKACQERRDVAFEILHTAEDMLEVNARKLRRNFPEELRYIEETGMMSPERKLWLNANFMLGS